MSTLIVGICFLSSVLGFVLTDLACEAVDVLEAAEDDSCDLV